MHAALHVYLRVLYSYDVLAQTYAGLELGSEPTRVKLLAVCGSGALPQQGISPTTDTYKASGYSICSSNRVTLPNDFTGIHRHKLAPPLFDGDCSKCQDWKHKPIAYVALQHADYTRLFKSSGAAQQ